MAVRPVSDALQALTEALELDRALDAPQRLRERIEALDRLDALLPAAGEGALPQRARAVRQRLEAINAAQFEAICQAVKDVDATLILYGLAGSRLIDAARKLGLTAASEVFADRTYQDDGSLTPRTRPDAMIEDVEQAVAQVVRMVREGKVRSVGGKDVAVQADTLCIHGDQPNALVFASGIRRALEDAGIEVRTPGQGSRPKAG